MPATSRSPCRSSRCPVVEAKLLEPVKLTWADARRRRRRRRARSRSAPGSAATPRRRRSATSCSARGDAAARARRRRPARARARRLGRAGGADAARRRARAAARRELRLGGRAPARGRAALRRAVRLRLPAQGRRHDRRRARARASLVVLTEAPGLATAGTGDVLTGILAAFLAKGLEPRLAAAAAATAHGLAARSLPQRGLDRERRRLGAARRARLALGRATPIGGGSVTENRRNLPGSA